MSRATQTIALRIYRRLAEAFPHEFKIVYGMDVIQLGEDVVEEIANQHGVPGLFRLIWDIAVRVPIEYLSEMRRDMLYAMRALIKSPGFALVGIVSLGLGMGVTTTVFSTLYPMMFRDLPGVSNPSQLVLSMSPASAYYVDQYRDQKSLFTDVAGFQNGVPFNVAIEGSGAKPERVFGHLVSPEYFRVLGVPAQRGRIFSPDAEKPGASPVVVISDRFWRNRLNSASDAIGRTLRLNGQPATIVGITPKDFNGAMPIIPAELFVPITVSASLAPELAGDVLHKHDAKAFIPLLRLAPGVTLDSAEAGIDTVARHLDDAESPTATHAAPGDKTRRVSLAPGGTMLPIPRNLRPVFIGFYAILIGLILTIACMNLANMLLARGAARRRELSIRLAVGASRFRLIRQLMSEGILLALLGGAAGLALAFWFVHLSSQMKLPVAVPIALEATLDWHAILFTLVLSAACGIGFSIAPALQATKADVGPTLKEGAAIQLRGYRRFGMRNILVVGQVAGSLMLLLLTGFLVIGMARTSDVQTKFDPNTMYLLSIDPVRDGYSPEKARAFFESLPQRLRQVPAVRNVALAAQPPFSIEAGTASVTTAPSAHDTAKTVNAIAHDTISTGFFAALNEPMLQGREFEDRDQRLDDSKDVIPIILNQTAALALFGSGSAIGQRIMEDKKSYEVIGLTRDLKSGMATADSSSVVYLPLTSRDFASPPPGGMTIIVRSGGGPDAMTGVRREIEQIDPNLAVFDVRTLAEYLDISRSYMRMGATIYGGIGVFGLLLAAIGLAGVTAYAVARRRKEIGIRMALGARQAQVLRLVLREGITLVAIGTILGFLGAMAMSKALASLTDIFTQAFQMGTNDPRLVFGAPVLLAALAMLACYIPARRSAKIDPLKALREE